MAGGKETPRQKMIGMMYLVLTALLALNVSKSILDAFVAIEENIQKANLTELYRGDEKTSELDAVAADKSNKVRSDKAKKYLTVVERINKMTAERIKLIDEVKLEILEVCGEDIGISGDHAIITKKYDPKKNPCKPARMNLDLVEGKDKYDDPMRVMLGDATDIKKPKGRGIEIWNSMIDFRKEITELIASTRIVVAKDGSMKFDDQFFFKAPTINKFNSPSDLNSKIKRSMESSNVSIDDKDVIMEIYRSLSKEEYSTVHDVPEVHWIGKTFDHAPSVAALASLSSLQKDVLAARAQVIAHIRNRVGGGDYNFNSIIPVAMGPEVVNEGDDFTLDVMMVAYDSDKKPRVTLNGEEVKEVRDGKGIVSLKGSGGVMELKGTVAIQNRQGIWKEREWSKTITVMKPSGSIELTGMNTLYRGYDNHVSATASGYPSTILSGQNATVTKSGDKYIVHPGSGNKAYLSVSGRTADGRTVQLKRSEYVVRRLPSATLFWGGQDGRGQNKIPSSSLGQAKYPPEIPLNARFEIISWSAESRNMKGGPILGTGSNFAPIQTLVNVIPPGTKVTITAKVRRPDNVIETISGVWIR